MLNSVVVHRTDIYKVFLFIIVVQFLNDSSSALESDGVISFTVISLMPTDRVFSVQVCTRDIPASAEGMLKTTVLLH